MFVPFALANLSRSLIRNTAFLIDGYLMRDGEHDLVTIGSRIIAIVFILELRHNTRRTAEDHLSGERHLQS